MTSKEALAKLNILNSYDTPKEKHDECEECFKVLAKDLDVLEIIKGKLLWLENDKIYVGLQNDTYIELTEDDFNYDDRYRILKEWLEK